MSQDILLELIEADSNQPRKHFDATELQALADSMRGEGQLMPLLLRPSGRKYIIVHGERRFRAAQLLEWQTLKAEVREMTADQAFRIAVIENVQRASLTPIEEARAYQRLIESGITQTAAGEMVGKTQSYVAHKIRLLKAPETLQALLAPNAITEAHMKQLLRFENLYPQGLMEEWPDDPAEYDVDWKSSVNLWMLYWVRRPEAEPPVEMGEGKGPYKVTNCPLLPVLRESTESLLAHVTTHGYKIPRWIAAAWWWGAATVVYEFPVSTLKTAIDTWHERYKSALLYMIMHPNPTDREGRNAKERSLIEDEKTAWWATFEDLKFNASLQLLPQGDAGLNALDALYPSMFTPEWLSHGLAHPSSLQPWGSKHDVAQRLLASDREKYLAAA